MADRLRNHAENELSYPYRPLPSCRGQSDEDYVQSAIAGGFEYSDFPTIRRGNTILLFVPEVRMMLDELPGYLASVRALRENTAIGLRSGSDSSASIFRNTCPGFGETIRRERLDYVIFRQSFLRIGRAISLFRYAHPDA